MSIINLATEFQLKLILSGVAEGWMVADQIAKSQAPVIMDPIYNLPTAFEHLGARLDNASILHEAGVELILQEWAGITRTAPTLFANLQEMQ